MVEWMKLGEVMKIVRGASPRPITSYLTSDSNGVNWIKIGDVEPGAKYITRCIEKVTKEGAQKSRYLHSGDFILSNSMSFGRPYILKIDGCIHDGWIAMSDFETHLSSGYLYEVLNSNRVQSYWKMKANNGGAMTNLNSDIVKDTIIPIPSLEEQARIVGILDTFTSAIDNLKEQIAQRRKQYEYYRDQLLDLEGKPGVEMKSLSNCCSLITKQTGFDYSKTIKPSLTTAKLDDSIPFIQNKDFEGTRINLNTDFYIPFSIAQQFPKIMLNEKILLVSISGKIGNVGLYELNNVSFVGGAICVCRLRKENNGRYILYYLLSHKGQSTLFRSVKAASHSNITVESIRETLIPLPSLQEQQRIVSILDTFEASIQNLEAQLKEREKQYEYYRNKLLTFE